MRLSPISFLSDLEAQMKDVFGAPDSKDGNMTLNERLQMHERQEWILRQKTTGDTDAVPKSSRIRRKKSFNDQSGAVPKSSLRVRQKSPSNDQCFDFKEIEAGEMT